MRRLYDRLVRSEDPVREGPGDAGEVEPARRAVDRFAVQRATLDDVFLALTGHPADRPDHEHEKEPAGV